MKNLKNFLFVFGFLAVASIFFAEKSEAQLLSSPSSLAALTAPYISALVTTGGIYGNHRPYATATPLKLVPGFEIGGDLTWVGFPTSFTSALSGIGVTGLSGLPMVKISIRKGLPVGLNLGFSGIYFSSLLVMGGDLQWSFLDGEGVKPAMALRASYNYSSLIFLQTNTWNIDLLLSKNLKVFDPYIGGGAVIVNGRLTVLDTVLATVPVSIPTSATAFNGHIFGGFSLKLLIIKMVFEGEYNFNGAWGAGGRFALSF